MNRRPTNTFRPNKCSIQHNIQISIYSNKCLEVVIVTVLCRWHAFISLLVYETFRYGFVQFNFYLSSSCTVRIQSNDGPESRNSIFRMYGHSHAGWYTRIQLVGSHNGCGMCTRVRVGGLVMWVWAKAKLSTVICVALQVCYT